MLRTRSAVRGMYTSDRARMTFQTPGPRAAMKAMARMIAGKAMSPSMKRMTTRSRRR